MPSTKVLCMKGSLNKPCLSDSTTKYNITTNIIGGSTILDETN